MNSCINSTVNITIWLPLQDSSLCLSSLPHFFRLCSGFSFLSPTSCYPPLYNHEFCINEERPITNSEQLFVYSCMTMEETVTKRTTLCYCQNVYLITFATLCLLFFCAYFIFYSYIAICDPQIEYKSFQDVCAAKNTTRALKMQQPLGTTWVQTITIAVDCVYMCLLIFYNFYCKADFTVLPQIADRTWEKK